MTQISSTGPSQLREANSSGAAAASALVSNICKPDVLVVLALCAVGIALTLIGAFSTSDLSDALTEVNFVGP